jgi:DNA-binding transcriptional ArsR family regulator/rhodanese-related sulfurtransferase
MINTASRHRSAVAHYGEIARLGKAMASPVRLQLLDLLRQGPRTVEDLADASGATVANSSRHLQQMRSARLVTASREGRHVRYRLAVGGVSEAFGMLRGLAETLLPEMDRLRRELGALEATEREALLADLGSGRSTLLDVRPAAEFEAGHLPGACSIPFHELPSRLGEVPRDRPVVAYCRGPYCPLALDAAEFLNQAGYQARHLDLGVPDLHPVRSQPGRTASQRQTRKSR